MNYILAHNEDLFASNKNNPDSGGIWYIKHIPDHVHNKNHPEMNEYRYTSNIDEALLVPESVKNEYLDRMKNQYTIADAYGCNDLTPENKLLIANIAKLICWDNGGETTDRYTVVSPNGEYVAMNHEPFHPMGFGQHGEGCTYDFFPCNTADNETVADGGYIEEGRDIKTCLGTLITFDSLPEDCKKLLIQDARSEIQSDAAIQTPQVQTDETPSPTGMTTHDLLGTLYHPAYDIKIKLKGYVFKDGLTVNMATDNTDAGKILILSNPCWSKEAHKLLAAAHAEANVMKSEKWNKAIDSAMLKTFGRHYQFGDYKVSGIGRDEFCDKDKDTLRHLAHSMGLHGVLAKAHEAAARQVNRYKNRGQDKGQEI